MIRVRGSLPAEKAVEFFDVRLAMFDLIQKMGRLLEVEPQICNHQSMKVQTVNLRGGGSLIHFQAVPTWLTKNPGTEEPEKPQPRLKQQLSKGLKEEEF